MTSDSFLCHITRPWILIDIVLVTFDVEVPRIVSNRLLFVAGRPRPQAVF